VSALSRVLRSRAAACRLFACNLRQAHCSRSASRSARRMSCTLRGSLRVRLQWAEPNLNRDRRPSLFEIPLAHDATPHTILHEPDQAQRPLEAPPGRELSQCVSYGAKTEQHSQGRDITYLAAAIRTVDWMRTAALRALRYFLRSLYPRQCCKPVVGSA
jgi:hypothetical protein